MKNITILSLLLAVALGIVSYCGAFVPETYKLDALSMAAQGIGQDIVDLFLVVPLLLVSLIYVRKNSKVAFFLFSGTVFYILYSFIIYCFGVHFNYLFLLYCITLGLSLYTFILVIYELNGMEVKSWFGDKTPIRAIGIFLLIVSAMFYMLWLKDIVPAIFNGYTPKSVSDYNLLVNPVHVIDIAIALPGLILTAILLMKKRSLGYILTPVCLVFVVILAIALAAMVVMLKIKNISDDTSLAWIFIVLAIISSVFLYLYLKNIRKGESTSNSEV